MSRPFKLGVAGTHSSGKTTFLDELQRRLVERGIRVGRVGDLATSARDAGFPILENHTVESTVWIVAQGLRQESELSLHAEVILVDRPPFDALGYLEAALERTRRPVEQERMEMLRAFVRAAAGDYHWLAATVLDRSLPMGPGRPDDLEFRELAARHIQRLADGLQDIRKLRRDNREELMQSALLAIDGHRSTRGKASSAVQLPLGSIRRA